jgi:hypothetical protein
MTTTTDIEAPLRYHLEGPDGGIEFTYLGSAGDKLRESDARTMPISDVRGQEEKFKLEENGFQYVRYPSQLVSNGPDYVDDEKVKKEGYEEVGELIKKV